MLTSALLSIYIEATKRTLLSRGVFFSIYSKIAFEKFASVNSISYLSIVMRE
jgi:hypothetical protein